MMRRVGVYGERMGLTVAMAIVLWSLLPSRVAAQGRPAEAADRPPYTIGIGDVLDVVVVGEPDVGGKGLTVGPDGTIGFPPIGPVQAEGATCEQLGVAIRDRLTSAPRWLTNPRVVVSVSSFNAKKINVVGAISKPGSYPHRPGLLIRNVVAEAGGLVLGGEGGASRMRATIVHADGTSLPVRLDQALAGEGDAGKLELQAGDTLIIELQLMVSIQGYVRSPGLLPVQDGTRLSQAIGMAGGVATDGDARRITFKSASGATRQVDLEAIIRTGEDDPALSTGDAIFVPRLVKQLVYVQGYVVKPGEFEIRDDDPKRVSEMIAQAGGPNLRASATGERRTAGAGDLTHVTLTRARGAEVLSLNIADVLSGEAKSPEADPIVEPGDAIFVALERNDVTVLGQVENPGRYMFVPGDKVTDALASSGGPIRSAELAITGTVADLANCTLFRASGEAVPLDLSLLPTGKPGYPNPALMPGDTLVVPESLNRVSISGYVERTGFFGFRPGDTVSDAIAMAGGVLPNVGSRQSISLRHADGTAEQVDLAKSDPPLAPGDEIAVPYARNRIAVVGSVNGPGLFEWHEGDTIIQAITAAGGPAPGDDGGDASHAALIRMVDGQQTITPLDFTGFFRAGDQSANVPLQPDDVVFVPRRRHTDYTGWLGKAMQSLSVYNLGKILFF